MRAVPPGFVSTNPAIYRRRLMRRYRPASRNAWWKLLAGNGDSRAGAVAILICVFVRIWSRDPGVVISGEQIATPSRSSGHHRIVNTTPRAYCRRARLPRRFTPFNE